MVKIIIKSAGYILLTLFIVLIVFIISLNYRNSSTANDKWLFFLYPSFYLKVEDQNNNPVAGARIRYTNGRNLWLYSDTSYGTTETDKNGMARFYLDGRSFRVSEIYKDGYHIDFRPQIEEVSNFLGSGIREKDVSLNNIDKPIIIHSWKFDTYPVFYAGSGSLKLLQSGMEEFGLLKNRNLNCLKGHVFSCQRKKSLLDEVSDGPIQFEMSKINGENNHRLSQGWSLKVSIPSGGIVETNDLYLYQVPKNDFKPYWLLERDRDDEKFMGGTHKFYIMLDNGKYYGRLYIDIAPFFRDNSVVRLEYFINAEGNRNLDSPLRVSNRNYQGINSYFNYE